MTNTNSENQDILTVNLLTITIGEQVFLSFYLDENLAEKKLVEAIQNRYTASLTALYVAKQAPLDLPLPTLTTARYLGSTASNVTIIDSGIVSSYSIPNFMTVDNSSVKSDKSKEDHSGSTLESIDLELLNDSPVFIEQAKEEIHNLVRELVAIREGSLDRNILKVASLGIEAVVINYNPPNNLTTSKNTNSSSCLQGFINSKFLYSFIRILRSEFDNCLRTQNKFNPALFWFNLFGNVVDNASMYYPNPLLPKSSEQINRALNELSILIRGIGLKSTRESDCLVVTEATSEGFCIYNSSYTPTKKSKALFKYSKIFELISSCNESLDLSRANNMPINLDIFWQTLTTSELCLRLIQ